MKEELRRHGVVYGGYFLLVTLARLYSTRGFGGDFVGWLVVTTSMWFGGALGYVLVFLDRLVYVYWLAPHEQLSQQVQYFLNKRDFWGVLGLIHRRRKEQIRLIFRSFLFIVAWVFLALFALTSKSEIYAQALVLGLGLHLVYDLWRDQRSDPATLNQKLFWQVKRLVPMRIQRAFLYVFFGVFGWLTLFIV